MPKPGNHYGKKKNEKMQVGQNSWCQKVHNVFDAAKLDFS
jgi:hypothetical protein